MFNNFPIVTLLTKKHNHQLTCSLNLSLSLGILNARGRALDVDVAKLPLFVTKPEPGKWFTYKHTKIKWIGKKGKNIQDRIDLV